MFFFGIMFFSFGRLIFLLRVVGGRHYFFLLAIWVFSFPLGSVGARASHFSPHSFGIFFLFRRLLSEAVGDFFRFLGPVLLFLSEVICGHFHL